MTSSLVSVAGQGGLTTAPSSTIAANRARGICSLKTASGQTFRFRTNPNSIRWKYVLNTNIEDTYGGRVIQILSTKITALNVQVEAGWGGWPYVVKLAYFLRDMMNEQRNGQPATFEYTTRNWKLKVFASSIPFTDTVGRPNNKIDMVFNVVEDANKALSSSTIGAELKRLKAGIGYQRSEYNSNVTSDSGGVGDILGQATTLIDNATGLLSGDPLSNLLGVASGPTSASSGGLGSLIPGAGGFLP